MRVLILQSHAHHTDQIQTLFTAAGHTTVPVANFEQALQICSQDTFDLALLPVVEGTDSKLLRDQIKGLKRAAREQLYVATISPEENRDAGLMAGADDNASAQSFTEDTVHTLISNVTHINDLIQIIGNNAIDFPSAGGIIARSAFNQLFLSALDRSSRYAEQSAIMLISIDNYNELLEVGGRYVADYVTAALSQILVGIRRQTDIIGQIKNEAFALLLQIPKNEDEPLEAAQRFAKTLEQHPDIEKASPKSVQIRVTLITVPTGNIKFNSTATTYIR